MGSAYVSNIVIDLEFTSVPRRLQTLGLQSEIIEVGAVKIRPDGAETGRFSCMVKPLETDRVSGGVRRLTGIGGENLVDARPLETVLRQLVEWIGPGRSRMVTWSGTDKYQVMAECSAKKIDASILPHRWLDIQKLYPRLMGTSGRSVALGEAADWCGISLKGNKSHRALDDALVTAELFKMMASGECGEQRAVLDAGIRGSGAEACTSSIASRCGDGLEALLASLRQDEGSEVA